MTSRKGKYMRIFAVIAVLALAVSLTALVACVDPADPDPGTGTTYKIIFDAGENMQDPKDIVLSGSSQIILPELTRPGYSFDGWYVDEDFEVSLRDYLLGNQVSHNITAYAKWTAIEYDLTASVNNPKAGFISVDGEEYEDYSATYVYGDEFTFTAISDPETADYYTFVGWYDDSGRQVQGGTTYEFTAGADDTDLEARWRGAQLKIFFHNDRATGAADAAEEVVAVTDYRYGDTFTYVPDYTADSIFVGWSYIQTGGESASDGDGKFELFQPADEYLKQSNEQGIRYELHLYAEWRDADFEFELSSVDGGYAVNGWKEAEYDGGTPPESFRIPSSFMGTPIVAVAENAFDNYFGSVFVPGSVTEIGANAFEDTAKVYFDADADYEAVSADLVDLGTDNVYFNILVWLNAERDIPDFAYPMYIENGDGIFDTDIDSEEEFIAVYSYCWLYNVGSMDLDRNGNSGGTKVTFNLENAGIAADKIIETVLGLNSKNEKVRSGWIDKAISMIGLKSNTATQYGYIYDPENGEYELTIMFKDMSENGSDSYSYVASRETDEFMQTQAGAVFAEAAGEANPVLLPIDSLPEYVVYNSEQLVYAVENGFKPRFGTLSATAPDHAKNALQSARDVWDTARRILYSINSDGDDTVEKLSKIHDYIALNVIYDSALLQLSEDPQYSYSYLSGYRGFNLEGALLDGKAVCDGITKAFMLLARMEGIECIRVTGKNADNVGHAWNKVKIENTWYNIDVTGDDILTEIQANGTVVTVVETLAHDKFLVSDDFLAAAGYREDDYGYVDATGQYNYYGWVTPTALQGVTGLDGDLFIADQQEMNALMNIAREKAVEAFLADDALEYVTFDMYWNNNSQPTSTVAINFYWLPLGKRQPNSYRGAFAIIIERGAVINA